MKVLARSYHWRDAVVSVGFAIAAGMVVILLRPSLAGWVGSTLTAGATFAAVLIFLTFRRETVYTLRRLKDAVQVAHSNLQDTQCNHYKQIEAMFTTFLALRWRAPLPPLGRWSASPDFLALLARTCFRIRPATVVELGSGVSTVVLGYCAECLGTVRIVSVDHQDEYAASTQAMLKEHGLARQADVRVGELKPVAVGEERFFWYDPSVFHGLDRIDLLVIDGPPVSEAAPHARFPALPVLYPRLAEGAVVLLDDAARTSERECITRWQAMFADLQVETMPLEKGAAVMTRRSVGQVRAVG